MSWLDECKEMRIASRQHVDGGDEDSETVRRSSQNSPGTASSGLTLCSGQLLDTSTYVNIVVSTLSHFKLFGCIHLL